MKKSLYNKIVADNIVTFVAMGVVTIILSMLSVLLSVMMTNIIDNILPGGNIKILLHHIKYYVLVSIGAEVFFLIKNYWYHVVDLKIGMKTRKDIVNKIFQRKGDFYSQKTGGEFYKFVVNDIDQICSFVVNNIFFLLGILVTLIASSIYLIYLNWKLFVAILLLQPIMWIVQAIIMPKIKKISEDYHVAVGRVISSVKELFTNPVELVISGCKVKMIERMNDTMDAHLKVSKKMFVMTGICAQLSDFLMTMTLCVVIGYGGYCIMSGEMTIGALLVFITYSQKNMSHVKSLVGFVNEYTTILPIYKNLNALYISKEGHTRSLKANNSESPSIELDDISFSYDKIRNIYSQNSYKFVYGKKYGIIGKSGEGKSTLIKLLFGLWETDKGNLYLGESNCNLLSVDEVSKLVSYVSINSPIINDTIFNNVILDSDQLCSYEEVVEALKKACLYDDVMKMEKGINTITGDGGALLSNGQRQRLLLARAFLGSKMTVILDEPASTVDQSTKKILMSNIYDTFADKLLIIISHDEDILCNCDEVVRLCDGKFMRSI